MANPKLATTDYVDGEVAKKQGYFADVSINETSGNRELSLKDATDKTVGQIIAQKEGGVLFKDVATPTEATDGANKGYADNNFANALKGTASGVSVRLDSVSPIEHTLGVKVENKNLIPPIDSVPYYFGNISNGKPYVPSNTNTISSLTNINVSVFRGVFTVKKLEEGKTYTLSLNGLVNNCATKALFLTVGFRSSEDTVFGTTYTSSYKSSDSNATSLTFTVPSGKPYCLIGFYNYPTASGDTVSLNAMQVEVGSTATAYTPYISDLSTVTVTRCGKNLSHNLADRTDVFLTGTPTTVYNFTDNNVIKGFAINGNATNYHVTEFTNTNGVISFKTSNVSYTVSIPVSVQSGKTYTVSANIIGGVGGNTPIWVSFMNNGLFVSYTATQTFTVPEGVNQGIFLIRPATANSTCTFSNFQLELGSTATPYEPYKGQTYTPAADGTVSGVKSLYPTTTLMTDAEGAIIDAEYNRDINKAFAEMQQAIISLGGNV